MYVGSDVAVELAARVLALRQRGVSRQRIGEAADLGSGAKIVRIERGGVQAEETEQLGRALLRLEAELGVVVAPPARTGLGELIDRTDQRSDRYDDATMRAVALKVGMRCVTCETWWSGATTAHCPTCHYTFTTPTLFDLHRVGEPTRRTCRHPSELVDHELPLRQVERGGALAWAYPVTDGARDRLDRMQAGTYETND